VAEVVDNIGDGIWLQLRLPESGEEEPVHWWNWSSDSRSVADKDFL
jgi:hypothetical protein